MIKLVYVNKIVSGWLSDLQKDNILDPSQLLGPFTGQLTMYVL